ncbi:MAG: PQQ-binding-like beta-propeller repeat protein [Campylobacterales bacterium]
MTRLLLPLFALLLGGCSKLAVYEPDHIAGKLSYDERLEAPIAAQTPQGATLENGRLLFARSQGAQNLPEGYLLLGIDGGWISAANSQGGLLLRHESGAEHRFNLPSRVLSAATDGRSAAVSTQDNSHRLIDLASGQTPFLVREKPMLAVSARRARPLLGQTQAVFPTLDGKLLIVDRAKNEVVREQVLGTEPFFANPIFLAEHEGAVIAATHERVIALGKNGGFNAIERNVRLLAPLQSGLYLFTLDGTVTRLSGSLETLESVKLPYARIVAAAEGDALYAVEQSGWLIRLSPDLKNYQTYELPDDIRAPLLAAEEKLYYGRKAVRWP